MEPAAHQAAATSEGRVKSTAPIATVARTDVLIADDHPLILDGLASVIDAEPTMRVVARAADGRTAVALCREHRPAVAVLDLQMPQLGGAQATEMIARSGLGTAVVVLTVHGGDEDIHRCVRAGARAFLLKSSPAVEILTAIRAAAAGRRYLSQDLGERLAGRVPCSDLTAREGDVLREIVRGKRNRDIAASLGLRESTVKWHVNALLGKLGVEDRVQAVVQALRRGLARLDE
jgi:DNA-binding NarL/FixJ family response regulator